MSWCWLAVHEHQDLQSNMSFLLVMLLTTPKFHGSAKDHIQTAVGDSRSSKDEHEVRRVKEVSRRSERGRGSSWIDGDERKRMLYTLGHVSLTTWKVGQELRRGQSHDRAIAAFESLASVCGHRASETSG